MTMVGAKSCRADDDGKNADRDSCISPGGGKAPPFLGDGTNPKPDSCPAADLVSSLWTVGSFATIGYVKITSVDELDCSLSSYQCYSPSLEDGACCGVCRCA